MPEIVFFDAPDHLVEALELAQAAYGLTTRLDERNQRLEITTTDRCDFYLLPVGDDGRDWYLYALRPLKRKRFPSVDAALFYVAEQTAAPLALAA